MNNFKKLYHKYLNDKDYQIFNLFPDLLKLSNEQAALFIEYVFDKFETHKDKRLINNSTDLALRKHLVDKIDLFHHFIATRVQPNSQEWQGYTTSLKMNLDLLKSIKMKTPCICEVYSKYKALPDYKEGLNTVFSYSEDHRVLQIDKDHVQCEQCYQKWEVQCIDSGAYTKEIKWIKISEYPFAYDNIDELIIQILKQEIQSDIKEKLISYIAKQLSKSNPGFKKDLRKIVGLKGWTSLLNYLIKTDYSWVKENLVKLFVENLIEKDYSYIIYAAFHNQSKSILSHLKDDFKKNRACFREKRYKMIMSSIEEPLSQFLKADHGD